MQAVRALVVLILISWSGAVHAGDSKPGEAQAALQKLEGSVAIVSMGAGWCKPCVRAWVDMQEWAGEHPGNGVRMLALSVDEDPSMLNASIKKYDVKLPLVKDPNGATLEQVGAVFGQRGRVPITFVIGSDGRVYRMVSGWIAAGATEEKSKATRDAWEELLQTADKLASDPGSAKPNLDKPVVLKDLVTAPAKKK